MRLAAACRSAATTAIAECRQPQVFGAAKRVKEERQLHTAEELVSGWRSIGYAQDTVGSRAYTFIGPLAHIENALLSYAVEVARQHQPRLTLIDVADVLPLETTRACGFPAPESSERSLQYTLADDARQCLSGTAEMGIAEQLRDRVFEHAVLPAWFLARSRCFRREISTNADESKLYRVHEFYKVEMFVVCEPKHSNDALNELVDIQKAIFASLGLHCRLVDMPKEELGAAAFRKYDIEAWMPGRGIHGEVSSASNCTDYQSSRLNIRYRKHDARDRQQEARDDDALKFVHTCNGTALASTRALIALLETHQCEKRKGVTLPKCLKPWLPSQRSPPVHLRPAAPIEYATDAQPR